MHHGLSNSNDSVNVVVRGQNENRIPMTVTMSSFPTTGGTIRIRGQNASCNLVQVSGVDGGDIESNQPSSNPQYL